MRKLTLLLSILLGSLFTTGTKNYAVTVTDSKTGNPVADASVKVKSTGKGAATNASGTASIQATAGDVLEVSSIGYASQEVTLSAQTIGICCIGIYINRIY